MSGRERGGARERFVCGLPDTSMFGPHRHKRVEQVFGDSDARNIAEVIYNTLRRLDGRPRWQDLDLRNPSHVIFALEALREAERQKTETRERRRAKSQREAEEDAAKLRAMKAEGKRCGTCNCRNDSIPFSMERTVKPGQFICDLYSDFYGYVFVDPSDICMKWSAATPTFAPPRDHQEHQP